MKKLIIGFCCYVFLFLPTACTYDQSAAIEMCDNNLSVNLDTTTPSACGIASGSITASVTGALPNDPITFSLNGADFQDSPVFSDLAAGVFTLTAKQGGCTATLEVTVENAEGLNATAAALPSECGTATGSITVSTADASGPVLFSLNGGTGQASAAFENLAPGDYQITATDEIGCQVNLEITVPSTAGFAQVEAIVTASCAISGCHAGNVSPDFRVKDNILNRANRIGSRTGNGTMPPPSSGGSLSQREIDAIACWIADGASE